MIEGMNSYMNMFAEDTKILKKSTWGRGSKCTTTGFRKDMGMEPNMGNEFNINTCSIMDMGKSSRLTSSYKMANVYIATSAKE